MEISAKQFAAANHQALEPAGSFPGAVAARYDRRTSRVLITLSSGLQLAFSPDHVQGLEHVHPADLQDVRISPSGMGIYFPHLDVDLSIPVLLQAFLGAPKPERRRNARREAFNQATLKAWEECQAHGQYATLEEVIAWLETWGEEEETTKTVKIGIMPQEKIRERVRAIASGDYKPTPNEPKVWFTSTKSQADWW
ncbi:MAG: DUF2442 domain-containing protein [Paludibacterium sp.]|uniref:DUF2442 domain-containing protein n=1 Tax=Paludibacterium sp. TaxID=1917523 RepID=UPI0025CC021C|nr:DUF2442 domain-containing protein [Paludibacterium sp.]MBV8046207.1 DUF2442 domain-containing protein [Paludibacterium sp.]MBV8646917.1 DUF2442 domain-containing protein [Paludibacterium sp.]